MAPSSSQVSGSTKKQLVPTRFVAYAKASRRTIEALFAAMLGLAALHRWRVVPRLEGEVLAGGGSRSLQTLRLTVTIEATLAVLIIAAVSILGTLNPHG